MNAKSKHGQAGYLACVFLMAGITAGCAKTPDELISQSCDNVPPAQVEKRQNFGEVIELIRGAGYEGSLTFVSAHPDGKIEYGDFKFPTFKTSKITVGRTKYQEFATALSTLRPSENAGSEFVEGKCGGAMSTDKASTMIFWRKGDEYMKFRQTLGGCESYEARVERCRIQNAIQQLGAIKPNPGNMPWL